MGEGQRTARRQESGVDTPGVPQGSLGATLDVTAKTAYKRRLLDLRATLAEAQRCHDLARAAQAQAEIDWLSNELAAAFGLGGRAVRSVPMRSEPAPPSPRRSRRLCTRFANPIQPWGITLPPTSRQVCSVSTGLRRASRRAGRCSLSPSTSQLCGLLTCHIVTRFFTPQEIESTEACRTRVCLTRG